MTENISKGSRAPSRPSVKVSLPVEIYRKINNRKQSYTHSHSQVLPQPSSFQDIEKTDSLNDPVVTTPNTFSGFYKTNPTLKSESMYSLTKNNVDSKYKNQSHPNFEPNSFGNAESLEANIKVEYSNETFEQNRPYYNLNSDKTVIIFNFDDNQEISNLNQTFENNSKLKIITCKLLLNRPVDNEEHKAIKEAISSITNTLNNKNNEKKSVNIQTDEIPIISLEDYKVFKIMNRNNIMNMKFISEFLNNKMPNFTINLPDETSYTDFNKTNIRIDMNDETKLLLSQHVKQLQEFQQNQRIWYQTQQQQQGQYFRMQQFNNRIAQVQGVGMYHTNNWPRGHNTVAANVQVSIPQEITLNQSNHTGFLQAVPNLQGQIRRSHALDDFPGNKNNYYNQRQHPYRDKNHDVAKPTGTHGFYDSNNNLMALHHHQQRQQHQQQIAMLVQQNNNWQQEDAADCRQ